MQTQTYNLEQAQQQSADTVKPLSASIRNILGYQLPEDLLGGKVTFPGRGRSYLDDPDGGLLPQSCMLTVYKGTQHLIDLAVYSSFDLRSGAGVKVVLDHFANREPMRFNWKFYLSQEHPDFNKITDQQKAYLWQPGTMGMTHWITVKDSMEGEFSDGVSIEQSWQEFYNLAQQGKNIVVDLSALRPNGTKNGAGLVATGAVGDGSPLSNESSFLAIYAALAEHLKHGDILTLLQFLGTLNSTMRRGGKYKNGIITSSMRWDSPYFVEYLNANIALIPGSHKKSARLGEKVLEHPELLDLIALKSNEESLFFEMIGDDPDLFWNVCVGLKLFDRGSCLIARLNIAQCKTLADIITGLVDVTEALSYLHVFWRKHLAPEKQARYLPLEQDRQIGVDILGFANFLAQQAVKYIEFVEALERLLDGVAPIGNKADEIALALSQAYSASVVKADQVMDKLGLPHLDRIHTIEPAQSHSYECFDLKGRTTVRGIWAPFGKKVRRHSDSQVNRTVMHGNVETSGQVGDELNTRLVTAWQRMMDKYGRSHGISHDWWSEADAESVADFITSARQTKYYSEHRNSNQDFLQKRATAATNTEAELCSILNKDECSVCNE